MRVRVLGAHNLEIKPARHTCFLLDGKVAIDAGSLVTSLSAEEQRGIRAILLTHRHFDHVRDLPTLGLSTLGNGRSISLYSLQETLDVIYARLMDGVLYPDFTTSLTEDGPKYRLNPISPGETFSVLEYSVRAIAVPHAAPTVGYVVHHPDGPSFAYCGDMGGGLLPFFEDPLRPDPLFVEVTFAGWLADRAKLTGHLTPELLGVEIRQAVDEGISLPRIIVVHRNPDHDADIARELAGVSAELKVDITLAQEDMTVDI